MGAGVSKRTRKEACIEMSCPHFPNLRALASSARFYDFESSQQELKDVVQWIDASQDLLDAVGDEMMTLRMDSMFDEVVDAYDRISALAKIVGT